ncbi:hypothetical protein RvY_03761 [Ramazzottius varieornatus]|uniref:Reverse transcriptase domain-containing protein n=1 Tax=Ramazzottius varieornatus TaxID=947166 RepID=A0A1D1USU7_RAMVA|nr:hypothetical protein RvY_03761 [Ramazzottius varieornatus]
MTDVVAVPKKGGSAFRPISLLPPLSELFEKILADHVTHFLDSNKLYSDSQFGFRRQRSTEMQLLQMCHQFSQVLLERKEADVIFLDCTKAFDRLPHDVVVTSLQKHGVDEHLLALFSDYLKDRNQRVMVDGFFSEEIAVKSGVPQGSILGPTFFTVEVNGLSGAFESRVLQYADDIVLYRKVSGEEDCHALQEDLNNLAKWCSEVGLEIKPQKSQHLRISNKIKKTAIPAGNYSFNAVLIPTEAEAECLGVTIASRMDWAGQVDKLTKDTMQTSRNTGNISARLGGILHGKED